MFARSFGFLALVFLVLGTGWTLWADVRDDASFFSPAEVKKANLEIRHLKDTHRRDLVVETFRSVPPNRSAQVRGMSKDQRDKFFADWGRDRGRQTALDDIHVLICKDPPHIQVTVGEKTQKAGITTADRDRIRDIFVNRFREKEFDRGLQEALAFLRGKWDANLPGFPPPVANQVTDQGEFFSPGAILKANAEIKDLQKKFQKDIFWETFKTVPPSKAKMVETMGPDARKKFFAEWMQERIKDSKKDGIFVLICREPTNLQVGVGPQAQKKDFTLADRDQLSEALLKQFRSRNFDQGLADGIASIRRSLETNTGPTSRSPLANEIVDHGSFFSDQAKTQATSRLKNLNLRFKNDVILETFATLPPSLAANGANLSPDDKKRVFSQWMQTRMTQSQKDGIHVLICKDPAHLEVAVGEQTRKKTFTLADRDKLRDLLVNRFQAKKYDEGLTEAVSLIAETVEDRLTPPPPVAIANQVRDQGGLLGSRDLESCNTLLKEIQTRWKQDVIVETFAAVPRAQSKEFGALDPMGKVKFLANWQKKRLAESKIDGIHILMLKQPALVVVGTGENTGKKAFGPEDATALEKRLTTLLGGPNFAMAGVLAGLYDTLDKKLSPGFSPQVVGEVRDWSNQLSKEGVNRANEILKSLKSDQQKTITIEIFPSGLPGEAKKLVAMDFSGRETYLENLVKSRQNPGSPSDLTIALCREPRIVGVYDNTTRPVLSGDERKGLVDSLSTLVREDKWDAALKQSVDYVQGTIAAPKVRDAGAVFSPEAIQSASQIIKLIRRDQGTPLIVTTFPGEIPTVPPTGAGIHLMIRKEPPQTRVTIEGVSPPYLFSLKDGDALKEKVQKLLDEKRYDDALADGALFVLETLKTNKANGPKTVPSNPAPEKAKDQSIASKIDEVKDQAIRTMEQDVNIPIWKLVLYLGGGFLGLWVLFGILRALFGGGGKSPPSVRGPGRGGPDVPQAFGQVPPQGPPGGGWNQPGSGNLPQGSSGLPPLPPQGPRPGYGGPGGAGYPPGQNPGNPPYGAGPQPGGWNQPGAYPGNNPPYGGGYPPQQQGGGGFMRSVLGGMLGGAAGGWIYDSMRGSGGQTHWGGSVAHGSETLPNAGRGSQQSTTGGDFGTSTTGGGDWSASASGASTTGGDFGAPQTGGGGDWSSGSSSSGGDFGATPQRDESQAWGSSAGGDFGSGTQSAGGDWASNQAAPGSWDAQNSPSQSSSSFGGDYGNDGSSGGGYETEVPPPESQSGSSWGDSPAQETWAPESTDSGYSGGADFGSGPSDGGGGDFGGGGDSGGSSGGGGDF